MATLYVTEPGSRIEKEYRHLLVTLEDKMVLRVPLATVSHVVLVGRGVGATTPALHALLAAGTTLSLVGRRGELLGRLTGPSGKNMALRRKQYAQAADPAFCLAFARQVVAGKLHNARTLALRWRRSRPDLPIVLLDRLTQAAAQAPAAPDLAALRGIEGAGSKAYFALLRGYLAGGPAVAGAEPRDPAPDAPVDPPRLTFAFDKRTRRPPRDPTNALLSLGYTLLGEAVSTALEVVGLDPYEGFFHADKYGRPALALDLVEEFRAPIVDSVVLTVINKRMIGLDDFEAPEGGGVYLNRHGLRVFLREFSDRLQSPFTHPLAGRPLTYQKCLEVQARQVAKVVMGQAPAYRPLRIR